MDYNHLDIPYNGPYAYNGEDFAVPGTGISVTVSRAFRPPPDDRPRQWMEAVLADIEDDEDMLALWFMTMGR